VSEELPRLKADMLDAVRRRAARHRQAKAERGPSLARNLGQIGALGWQIVVPALLALALGRWLDHRLATGIFWTAPLLFVGIGLGCWSAWKWLGRQ
jgi:ATP synthase protein I